ncbi:Rieske (2Fe-2S) protein [Aestuariimicrobium soli]|uniref:Rieske (2Fe-2S) protein n=1 Tax=Aestuariimicrobium soli TaxID=2035834 RepID=UPI003EC05DDC
MDLSRRGLVAAATCATCGLAACSTDAGTGSPSTGGTSEPSKSLETASSGAISGGKNVPKSSIPVGGGLIVSDGEIVITQPTQGDFKGFTSICTHQQCPVTSVEDGVINCNCHGSQFSISDGSVVRGPASEPLASKPVTQNGDQITLG